MTRVGIISAVQTVHESEKTEMYYDYTFHTATKVLREAGLERKGVDNLVFGEYDLAIGRCASHVNTVGAAGGFYKDEVRINDDGLFAAVQAYLGILSGEFDVTMVISTGISSEAQQETASNLQLDPFYYRPVGLHETMANALQVARYRKRYGITGREGALVAVKNRSHAEKNPYAHLRDKITEEMVLDSDYVSYPLRKLEVAPRSDGVCALIMAAEPIARRLCAKPVWIDGLGWNNDTYYLGERDLSELKPTKLAARQAYKMAGIKEPRKEIDVAEVFDITAYHELMAYEALGFCQKGEAADLLASGATSMSGDLPVNLSGGVLNAYPQAATGLVRLVEAANQIMGKAEGIQATGVKTALAHSISGWSGQRGCVFILRGEGK